MRYIAKYNIHNIEIVTSKGAFPIKLDQLNSFVILESINTIGISAVLSFLDSYRYIEQIPLIGGETVVIYLEDDVGETLTLEFINSRLSDTNKVDATFKSSVSLNLIQTQYYKLKLKTYPKSIVNKNTVNEVFSDMIYMIGYIPEQIFDDKKSITLKNKNLVFPTFWNCEQCLEFMLSNNYIDGNFGSTLIYDKKISKFSIVSVVDFLNEDANNLETFTFLDVNNRNYIREFTLDDQPSAMSFSHNMLGTNTMISADVDKKKIQIKKAEISSFFASNTKKLSNISDETVLMDSGVDYYMYTPFLYAGHQEMKLNNRRTDFLSNMFKIKITISGRFSLELGQKVNLNYYKNDDNMDIINGNWIIVSLLHRFTSAGTYDIDAVLIKEELNPNKNNRVYEK